MTTEGRRIRSLVSQVSLCYRVFDPSTFRNPAPGSGWTEEEIAEAELLALKRCVPGMTRLEVAKEVALALDEVAPVFFRAEREKRAKMNGGPEYE